MDWFLDIYGSYEKPEFRFDFVRQCIDHRTTSLIEVSDDVKSSGWRKGWIRTDDPHFKTHVYAEMIDQKIAKVIPFREGFPVAVSSAITHAGYTIEAWFNNLPRPYKSTIVVGNGQVKVAHHHINFNTWFSHVFYTDGDNDVLSVCSTEFIKDPILKVEWMSIFNSKDTDRISDFLLSHGCTK